MTLRVAPGPLLSERTTLGLGGRTLAEITVGGVRDCEELGEAIKRTGGAPLALGGGSNILAHDGELPLCLVRLESSHNFSAHGPETAGGVMQVRLHDIERFLFLNRTREFAEIDGADIGKTRVRAYAGATLPRFLAFLAGRGLSGLSGLSGVPGTVGGAVAGNAGSYGSTVSEVLAGVRVYAPGKGVFWAQPKDWLTGYRRFELVGLTGFYLIVEADFDCPRAVPEAVKAAMRRSLALKKASQPIGSASAGCVFKNPPEAPAGKLLDELGFRGKRLGGMAFSERHANFLVNLGGGTSREAFELIELGREAVRTAHNVELELEVRVAP